MGDREYPLGESVRGEADSPAPQSSEAGLAVGFGQGHGGYGYQGLARVEKISRALKL